MTPVPGRTARVSGAQLQGRTDEFRRLAADALAAAIPRRLAVVAAAASWNLARLDRVEGRPAAALERLLALNNPKDPTAHTTIALLATRELVEAAARTGRLDGMEPYVARLERWAAWDQRMFTLLVARRCRALISQGDQAERHYQAALATDGIGELPYELALTELLYGEWLRRARRRVDARTRAQSTLDQLTSQELEVARLAAQGLTNRQIADQLFLSTHTVGYHLGKIYAKLGIASRAELSQLDLNNHRGP